MVAPGSFVLISSLQVALTSLHQSLEDYCARGSEWKIRELRNKARLPGNEMYTKRILLGNLLADLTAKLHIMQ